MLALIKSILLLLSLVSTEKVISEIRISSDQSKLIFFQNINYYYMGESISKIEIKKNTKEQKRKTSQIVTSWRYNQSSQNLNLFGLSKDWTHVISSKHWHTLRILDLAVCKLNALKLKILVNTNLTNLLQLNLKLNKLDANSIKMLTKVKLQNMDRIMICNCEITNEGIRYLMKSHWPKLTKIDLSINRIKMEGLNYLALENWKNISLIWAADNQLQSFLYTQHLDALHHKKADFTYIYWN